MARVYGRIDTVRIERRREGTGEKGQERRDRREGTGEKGVRWLDIILEAWRSRVRMGLWTGERLHIIPSSSSMSDATMLA